MIEEEKQGGAVTKEEPKFGTPPLRSKGGAVSKFSMADDGLTQHNSDVMVEEE